MNNEPAQNIFMIEDLETMRTVADPLRVQMLELLVNKTHSARELAGKLGLAPSRLYYHINQLEKLGLIVVEETRQVGNLLEKYYRATAGQFEVSRSLLNFQTDIGKESISTLMVSTLDTTRDDLLRSLNARSEALARGAAEQPRNVIVTRCIAHLNDAQIAEYTARVQALLAEFQGSAPDQDNSQPFVLAVALYPTYYYPSEEEPAK